MSRSSTDMANSFKELANLYESNPGFPPPITNTSLDIHLGGIGPTTKEDLARVLTAFGSDYTVSEADWDTQKATLEISKFFGCIKVNVYAKKAIFGSPTEVEETTTRKIYPIPEEILKHVSPESLSKLTCCS